MDTFTTVQLYSIDVPYGDRVAIAMLIDLPLIVPIFPLSIPHNAWYICQFPGNFYTEITVILVVIGSVN